MTTDGILVEQIKKEFGILSYLPDGSLNRAHISQTAFGNPDRLRTLNGFVHPRVALDYRSWMKEHQQDSYVIREAALLYEAKVDASLGMMVVVHAPERIRIDRVKARDPHRTESEIKAIMKNQWPDEEKMKRADAIIYNDDQHLVIPQVLQLHQQFISRK